MTNFYDLYDLICTFVSLRFRLGVGLRVDLHAFLYVFKKIHIVQIHMKLSFWKKREKIELKNKQ